MPLKIVRNDIVKMEVDAIVNAANTSLKIGGGVCGVIFKAAGVSELQKECDDIGYCETGEAIITSGYALPAKYIIHTPGPIWNGGDNNEEKLLYNSYYNSLTLAYENKCESIAFPLISTGIYGYPIESAIEIAQKSIKDFLLQNEMTVFLVVFDKNSYTISQKRFLSIKEYIDDIYADKHINKRYSMKMDMDHMKAPSLSDEFLGIKEFPNLSAPMPAMSLIDVVKKIEKHFQKCLFVLLMRMG